MTPVLKTGAVSYLPRMQCVLASTLFHSLLIILTTLLTLSLKAPKNDDFTAICSLSDALPISPNGVPADVLTRSAPVTDSNTIGSSAYEATTLGLERRTARASGDDNDGNGGGNQESSPMFLDDVLNIGDGPPSPGHDDGWGGGVGLSNERSYGSESIGGDFSCGRGHGCFGCRLRNRAGQATDNCIVAALAWLAHHQSPDGHWDTRRLGSYYKTDTAMTALALLAFLGAGHTERIGQYRDNVKSAVAWLKSKQQSNGLIFDNTDAGSHRGGGYPHAIATAALAEAAGMANNAGTREAAQRAINYAQTLQHESGGWRYAPGQAGDLSVTGWYVMAFKSAKLAGLRVNPDVLERAGKFLDSVEIHDGAAARFGYQPNDEHAKSAHLLTAIGALARMHCGGTVAETKASVEWFINKGGLPDWGTHGESVDLYYWYYGSLCAFQHGGELWRRFNHGMVQALTKHQCKGGDDVGTDEAGSWPVVGEFSDEWGRVGQTALGALCLEVYYRYERLKN